MSEIVLLETSRRGYSPDQCGRTMTVGELIEHMSHFDEDSPVYFSNDNGYTYGAINMGSIRSEYSDEDDEDDEDGE